MAGARGGRHFSLKPAPESDPYHLSLITDYLSLFTYHVSGGRHHPLKPAPESDPYAVCHTAFWPTKRYREEKKKRREPARMSLRSSWPPAEVDVFAIFLLRLPKRRVMEKREE